MGLARFGIESTLSIVCPNVFLHEHQKTRFVSEILEEVRKRLVDPSFKFDDKLTDNRSFHVSVGIRTRKEVENEQKEAIPDSPPLPFPTEPLTIKPPFEGPLRITSDSRQDSELSRVGAAMVAAAGGDNPLHMTT